MCKNVTDTLMISVQRMEKNDFDVRTSANITWYNDNDTCPSNDIPDKIQMTSEEDYLLLSLDSPFKHMNNELIIEIQDRINKETLIFGAEGKKEDLDENARFSSHLLDYLKKYYFNISPLWTGLLCGDVTRHAKSYCDYASYNVSIINNTLDNRTSGAIEQRFYFPKHIICQN